MSGVGEGGEGVVVAGDDGEEVVGDDGGGGFGDEEAGGAEAEGAGGEVGCGDAGGVGYGDVDVFADGDEGLGLAEEPCGAGWVADVFDGEAEADGRGGLIELGLADGLEELCAVAEEGGGGGGGVPEDVAEAAEGGDLGGDGVPVGNEGLRGRGADAFETLAGLGDLAGVEGGELEGRAGGERLGEGDDGFFGLAGVVGVGVNEMLGVGEGWSWPSMRWEMLSQWSVEESWSGRWVRGWVPVLRTVKLARTAMWDFAGWRWTSRS